MTFPKHLKTAGLLPLLLLLTQCDQVEALFKPKPEKPSPYAFDVILKMSPEAEAELHKPHAGLSAEAWYYGDAAPAHRDDADKLNRIVLGAEDWTYAAGTRKLHLHGDGIDPAKLAEVRDGQPQVILTVWIRVGSMAGDPDNPLSCQYTGMVRVAQRQPPVMHCEYDTERYWETASSDASD